MNGLIADWLVFSQREALFAEGARGYNSAAVWAGFIPIH